MVEHLSDDEIRNLSRGGHDYRKVYAAFKAATEHVGQPTVILAHTIKGWTLGPDFEARNATHQMKKLTVAELKEFRDRLYLEIPDAALEAELPPYYHPGEKSDEIQYMRERRAALGGYLPRRVIRARPLVLPGDSVYEELRRGSGKQSVATTMAFVRLLKDLMKDPEIGDRFAPVIPDVRHGLAVPDREDLRPVRADLRGRGPQSAAVLQGVQPRADPARGHQRGRRDGVDDGGRDRVRHPRHAHDPGLHLLLDVRIPADR
jgi:pyruvate dehydrogenase complex dehydrogenase (E1) component